jgi:hypothetical protein
MYDERFFTFQSLTRQFHVCQCRLPEESSSSQPAAAHGLLLGVTGSSKTRISACRLLEYDDVLINGTAASELGTLPTRSLSMKKKLRKTNRNKLPSPEIPTLVSPDRH